MKKIDFTQTGGFPLRQDTLDFMQGSYKELEQAMVKYLTELAGFHSVIGINIIVSGLQLVSTSQATFRIQPGWIIKDDQLLYFSGAFLYEVQQAGGIGVESTSHTDTFKDGSEPTVYFEKYAIPGGTNPTPYYDFIRLNEETMEYRAIDKLVVSQPIGVVQSVKTFTLNIMELEAQDLILANFAQGNQNYQNLVVSAEYLSPGQAIVRVINTGSLPSDDLGVVEFSIRVIK